MINVATISKYYECSFEGFMGKKSQGEFCM